MPTIKKIKCDCIIIDGLWLTSCDYALVVGIRCIRIGNKNWKHTIPYNILFLGRRYNIAVGSLSFYVHEFFIVSPCTWPLLCHPTTRGAPFAGPGADDARHWSSGLLQCWTCACRRGKSIMRPIEPSLITRV